MSRRMLMLSLLLSACLASASSQAALIDRIVATVNGEAILLSEVDALCQAALEGLPANLPWNAS